MCLLLGQNTTFHTHSRYLISYIDTVLLPFLVIEAASLPAFTYKFSMSSNFHQYFSFLFSSCLDQRKSRKPNREAQPKWLQCTLSNVHKPLSPSIYGNVRPAPPTPPLSSYPSSYPPPPKSTIIYEAYSDGNVTSHWSRSILFLF